MAEKKIRLEDIRKAADVVIDKVDRFLGPSGKAWLANGLDELRQAVALGSEQIHAGNNPGLWGTITTGEATAERLAGQDDKQQSLQLSLDVPQKKFTLDEMRGMIIEKNNELQKDHGIER